MLKRSQHGFGVVELLCFIVMFSMVGLIGWYVINENMRSQETLDNIGGAEVQTSSAKPAAKAGDKFVFKELGVQITLPDELKDMTYTTEVLEHAEGKPTILNLATPRFSELAAICWKDDPVGSPYSFQIIQKKNNNDTFSGTKLKQFEGFYIGGNELPDFSCEQEPEFEKLGQSLNKALNTAFETATLAD